MERLDIKMAGTGIYAATVRAQSAQRGSFMKNAITFFGRKGTMFFCAIAPAAVVGLGLAGCGSGSSLFVAVKGENNGK
jgi:hypothetical protein